MRLIPLTAAVLLLTAPAFAQQNPPQPVPTAPTSQAQSMPSQGKAADKGKADKAKADKAAKAKADKPKEQAKANERSNKGGAMRGEERAGQVKDMNNQRKTN